jgi:iron complex transport system ATP-binding protein
MADVLLKVCDLKAGYYKKEIVHGVSFEVHEGEFVCVIGANGCGKTTVLKSLLGLMKPFAGTVSVRDVDALSMNESERARHFAYIPQAHTPPFPFTVADVVIMGRTPYINRMAKISERDRVIAYRALKQLSIAHLANATYTKLSGGQQQLVLIARALAQQPEMLVMDEPTASLDFGNQHLVLSQMRALANLGMSVLMVTHDPDHALFCADRVIVMEDGHVIGDGTPEEVITTENLVRIYDAKVCVTDVSVGRKNPVRVCIPLLDEH